MKNTLKKVLFSLGAIGLLGAGNIGFLSAANPSSLIGDDVGGGDENFNGQDRQYNPGAGTDTLHRDSLIKTIKNFINRVLGLLSLIALAICLRGGFQMLTASGDETKYKKGFTILKQAGFGLAIIALAWLIVSVIFRIINLSVTGNNGTSTGS